MGVIEIYFFTSNISAISFRRSQQNIHPPTQCELCDRTIKNLTAHHLIPRQYTKRKKLETSATIDICSACHRQVHVLFDNKSLARELNTAEALKNEPKMRKFLIWVGKQNPDKKISVRRNR